MVLLVSLAAASVVGLISAQGLLPGGLDLGQTRQAATSALPGAVAQSPPLVDSFAIASDQQTLQRPMRITVYGRHDQVTDISLNYQKDESGDVYRLLSERLVRGLGPASPAGRGENIEDQGWRRGSVTVSLRRVMGKVTEISISDTKTSVFRVE